MVLCNLAVEGFRNLSSQHISFFEKQNYLFGENAQGKTNLLEAVYLLCLCKSFRTSNDTEMISLGKRQFNLMGQFIDQNKIEHEIHLQYQPSAGKQVFLDGKPLYHLSSLVGQFPVVVLSVADYDITHGSPQQRRRFFNILASQCSARYLADLKEYEKIIKQRNRILWLAQTGKQNPGDELDVWDEQLILKGISLITFRSTLVSLMDQICQKHYRTIANSDQETLSIAYQPNVEHHDIALLYDRFKEKLQHYKRMEISRGISLVGPHRDEFRFAIGVRPLRHFGSRGEHKSALISIKAAELAILKRYLRTSPVILLDDLYAELDQERGERVMELFSGEGQCFISGTSADFSTVHQNLGRQNEHFLFFVREGKIEKSINGAA